MANFDLNNYEEVKDRLPKFWEKHPLGRIVTDLMSPVTDIKTVVFKATISVGENIIATGWAMERKGTGISIRPATLKTARHRQSEGR